MTDLTHPDLCRIRAITIFQSLTPDQPTWATTLAQGKAQCDHLANALTTAGYTVQSLRIVTNPFGEYLNTQNIHTAKAGLTHIRNTLTTLNHSGMRIRFAIGEARNAHEIALLPELIADFGDLCNACVNITNDTNGLPDHTQIEHSIHAIQRIATLTPRGEGNFNFTVNFNCPPLIPYFPAAYHRGEQGNGFVIGLETPDLLAEALRALPSTAEQRRFGQARDEAYLAMTNALQYHIDAVNRIIASIQTPHWQYFGMDTSAAPSKNCTSMATLYEQLGVPHFGAAGSIAASALLTRVFKNLKNVNTVGFSGLMLAVTEDTGLAEATRNNHFDIRALLTYSSVCGIGLDTVPIAGDTPAEKIADLMLDTATLAWRLNKPLTVRLFPVPNKQAGDHTEFQSDDLCNCAILAVP